VVGDDAVLQHIEDLLSAPASGAGAPTLEHIEHTLTEGYAQALALEAERWRLERRIGEVARQVDDADFSAFAEELMSLGRSLTSADGELAKLRPLLASLQARARTARVRTSGSPAI
jgi:hypothetical protein